MQETLLLVGMGVIFIVVIALVALYFYRKANPKKQKRKGQNNQKWRAVNTAKNFARTHGFRCLAPANITCKGNTAGLDALVIGYFGILGVKALGYNGEIYGDGKEKDWLQVNETGERTPFPNPIMEASSDVRVIREALFAKKLKQIPVEVVCVFTDDKVQLAVPRSAGHYAMKDYKALLNKEKYLDDTGLDLDTVEKAIRAALSNTED